MLQSITFKGLLSIELVSDFVTFLVNKAISSGFKYGSKYEDGFTFLTAVCKYAEKLILLHLYSIFEKKTL